MTRSPVLGLDVCTAGVGAVAALAVLLLLKSLPPNPENLFFLPSGGGSALSGVGARNTSRDNRRAECEGMFAGGSCPSWSWPPNLLLCLDELLSVRRNILPRFSCFWSFEALDELPPKILPNVLFFRSATTGSGVCAGGGTV
jgi:hypothetical protein